MKIDNTITLSELEEVGDIWYQRLHKVRVIWQDEKLATVAPERCLKAYNIWRELCNRVLFITHTISNEHQKQWSKTAFHFKQGGI